MRYKQAFIQDIKDLVIDELKHEVNVVEDAAEVLKHTPDGVYTLPEKFSKSKKDEKFIFEERPRPDTQNPDIMIPDWFYIGKEGA